MFDAVVPPHTVIPGARARLRAREPGISACFALNMSRFRVRVRQVPAAPRNDERETLVVAYALNQAFASPENAQYSPSPVRMHDTISIALSNCSP